MTALAQIVGVIFLGSMFCHDLGFSETWGKAARNIGLLLLAMVVGLGLAVLAKDEQVPHALYLRLNNLAAMALGWPPGS